MILVRNLRKLTARVRDGGREYGDNTFVDNFTGERFRYPHRDLSIACRIPAGGDMLALMVPDMWQPMDEPT